MHKITYSTTQDGAKITLDGKAVEATYFKVEHSVNDLPRVTLTILCDELTIEGDFEDVEGAETFKPGEVIAYNGNLHVFARWIGDEAQCYCGCNDACDVFFLAGRNEIKKVVPTVLRNFPEYEGIQRIQNQPGNVKENN